MKRDSDRRSKRQVAVYAETHEVLCGLKVRLRVSLAELFETDRFKKFLSAEMTRAAGQSRAKKQGAIDERRKAA